MSQTAGKGSIQRVMLARWDLNRLVHCRAVRIECPGKCERGRNLAEMTGILFEATGFPVAFSSCKLRSTWDLIRLNRILNRDLRFVLTFEWIFGQYERIFFRVPDIILCGLYELLLRSFFCSQDNIFGCDSLLLACPGCWDRLCRVDTSPMKWRH